MTLGKKIFPAFYLLALFNISTMGAFAGQYRAYWVSTWSTGVDTASECDTLIANAQASNCNVLLVQVRRRGDAFFPSPHEPWCTSANPSFDTLAYLIKKAHAAVPRMEVHAYMVTLPAYDVDMGTVSDAHPRNLYPQFFTKNNEGTANTEDMDPGHPDCLKYIADVYLDVVSRYDVDGIHYDYIRFLSNANGYNDQSVARYNAFYNLSGTPGYLDSQWKQWRRDQVTALARQIYARTLAATQRRVAMGYRPWVNVSGSTITWGNGPGTNDSAWTGTSAYNSVFQDWRGWMEEGILDCNIPMTYYNYSYVHPTSGVRYSDYYKNWIEYQKNHKYNRHLAIGLGNYLNSIPDSCTEIKLGMEPSSRNNSGDGLVFFRYGAENPSPVDSAGFRAMLTTPNSDNDNYPPFPDKQLPPPMTWKESPTTANLMGVVTRLSGAQSIPADFATVSITGPVTRTQRVDGNGFYAFIDLPPGTYSVTASRNGIGTQTKSITISSGDIPALNFHIGGADTTPPVISGVNHVPNTAGQAAILTDSKAIIVWNTDEPADSQVEYGTTTSYGNLSPLDPMLSGSRSGYQGVARGHVVTLFNLNKSTTYHYRVISRDSSGNVSVSSDKTFTTVASDSTLPGINSIQVSGITRTGATITWNTTEPASTQVEYGTSVIYGSSSSLNSAKTLSHTVTLTGLTAGTLYHFRVKSQDASNNLAVSWDMTFTTVAPDTTPPALTNVRSTAVTSLSATIAWTTNEASSSQVEYGTTVAFGNQTTLDPAMVTSHSVSLTGLTPNTLYYYRAKSKDADNNEGVSGTYTFTTSVADTTPPIISGVYASGIGTGCATISWTTNEASTSQVEYGPDSSFGAVTQEDTTRVTNHSVTLTGLTANTCYHYRVISRDASGNSGVSEEHTFTIGFGEIIIDNLDPGFEIVSGTWGTGTKADRYATNYRWSNLVPSGNPPSAAAKWTPNIPVPGNWEVYAWWSQDINRTSNAPYTVYYHGGSQTVRVDQRTNGGKWNLLGTFPMAPGTANYVTVANDCEPDTGLVVADALRFVPVMKSFTSPAGFVRQGWNLVSLPGAPRDPNPLIALSTIDVPNSSLQYWNNTADGGGFVGYGMVSGWLGPLLVGTPYWFLDMAGGKTLSFTGTESVLDYQVTIPSHSNAPYWIMLGQPFDHETLCANIRFSTPSHPTPLAWENAYSVGIVESTAQCFKNGGFVSAGPAVFMPGIDRFEPWHGYWLMIRVTEPVTVTIPVTP